jgi:hypothetical protein
MTGNQFEKGDEPKLVQNQCQARKKSHMTRKFDDFFGQFA